MQLTSPEFEDGTAIPPRFTCEGDDVSPPLAWSGVPEGTRTLALTCEDPDAPSGTFVHWVLWNLDPGRPGLEAGEVPAGARHGRNGWEATGYGGPCPPPGHGTHHYRFTLAALDAAPDLPEGTTIEALREAIREHTLAHAALVGTYERGAPPVIPG